MSAGVRGARGRAMGGQAFQVLDIKSEPLNVLESVRSLFLSLERQSFVLTFLIFLPTPTQF